MKPAAPEYLCIGHCCHDQLGDRVVLGGTASYSGLVAARLGLPTGIFTSTGPEFAFAEVFEKSGICWWNKPAPATTVFENIYHDEQRTQYLHRRAETLFAADLPEACRSASIVLFCPIADEVDFSLLQQFPHALKGATIQGWLRQWDTTGKVSPKAMDWAQLAAADVVILSDADIRGFEDALPAMAAAVASPAAAMAGARLDGFDEADPATWGNPGRNDMCPCGSGEKFKHCHGKLS